jgi:hypothetical protein
MGLWFKDTMVAYLDFRGGGGLGVIRMWTIKESAC